MRILAVLLFGAGVLLSVRVMFFGVRRSVGTDAVRTRAWPLSFATALAAAGLGLYAQALRGAALTPGSAGVVAVLSVLAGMAAWWTVRQTAVAAAASPDPDEDPKYRFQGHVARVVSPLAAPPSAGRPDGRVAFIIDDRRLELAARWLPGTTVNSQDGLMDSEVVIEHVDGDVAFVEPWALVEGRL